jgi:adenosine deaminase
LCHLRFKAHDLLPEILQAEDFLHLIIGVGLDSCELGYPPSLFQEVFNRAEALGLKRVAHAGAPPALPARTWSNMR